MAWSEQRLDELRERHEGQRVGEQADERDREAHQGRHEVGGQDLMGEERGSEQAGGQTGYWPKRGTDGGEGMAVAEYLASSLMWMGLSGTRIPAYLDDVGLHACGRVDDGHGTGQKDVGQRHHGQRHAHDAGEGVRLAHGACREGGGGRGQWVRAGEHMAPLEKEG